LAESNIKELVPVFIIYIDNTRIPPEIEAVVKDVIVTGRINAASSFQITLAVPGNKKDDVKKWIDKADYAPGAKVKIKLGYKDAVEDVFAGEITSLMYELQSANNNTISIRGYDLLHKLNRGKKTVSFARKTEGDIISEIASAIQLSTDLTQMTHQQEFTLQKNMTDFDYIRALARRNNSIVWCDAGKMYVKPVQGSLQEVAVLERDKTLIHTRLTTACQSLPTEVEVRGWDAGKFQTVTGSAKTSDITIKVGGNTLGLNKIKSDFGDSKMTYIDESIPDINTANKVALGLLTNLSFDYMTGTATTYGNNAIKAAALVKLEGVGDLYSGKYLVDSVKHHLNVFTGYRTTVALRRNATK